MNQKESKETKLNEAVQLVLDISKESGIPVTIITAANTKQTAVYHSGNILDQATHFMALESLLEENKIPIELQKMLAVAADGDPSKVCRCPKCTAKRAVETEREGSTVSEESIKEMVFSLLRGDIR